MVEWFANARLAIELVQADMRGFVRPEGFDLALSLFTSFGYFDDAEDDLRVLRNVHRSLRVYSGRELRDLLVRAGFSSVDLYGGLDGRRYGLEAERLVVVASKQRRDAD